MKVSAEDEKELHHFSGLLNACGVNEWTLQRIKRAFTAKSQEGEQKPGK